jgi:cell division protein FtsB
MARGSHRYQRNASDASQHTIARRLLIALFAFSVLMSLPLAVNILSRIQAEAKMRAEQERLTTEVERTEKCLQELDTAVEYAKSDAYVESWARERERLGKQGEVVIVPASNGSAVHQARPWWEERVDCGAR